MKLQDGIELYLDSRQTNTAPWSKGAQCLRSFNRQVGNLALDKVRVDQVVQFLDGSPVLATTRYNKYSIVRQFFLYWKARQKVHSLPLPPPRRTPERTFVPYVYSRAELQRLLTVAGTTQRDLNCVIGAHTFRTLLLLLYGTGAMLSEAVQLERRDVDFRRRRITFRSSRTRRVRTLPIGADLYAVLRKYDGSHRPKGAGRDSHFLLNEDGSPVKVGTANKTFRRVCKLANVARHDGARYPPRLHDLRHTFAVHRLTAWLKHGADMGRMIPALSAYLGQHDLAAAERYLRHTPERFRAQLDKLSPRQRGNKRWREDAELMRFLDSL
jgi:integrase/recombinase XerD